MTPSGWTIMIVSVTGVVTFFAWCLSQVFANRDQGEHLHSPSDIDTHDRER